MLRDFVDSILLDELLEVIGICNSRLFVDKLLDDCMSKSNESGCLDEIFLDDCMSEFNESNILDMLLDDCMSESIDSNSLDEMLLDDSMSGSNESSSLDEILMSESNESNCLYAMPMDMSDLDY